MLLRRLSTASAAAIVVLTACAGADGTDDGAIRENVVEPGLEAIDESRALACSSEASSFRTVLEIYEVREGEPAPDEAALIAHVRSRLAGFKTPKKVVFQELPKTSTGKIQKFELWALARRM